MFIANNTFLQKAIKIELKILFRRQEPTGCSFGTLLNFEHSINIEMSAVISQNIRHILTAYCKELLLIIR